MNTLVILEKIVWMFLLKQWILSLAATFPRHEMRPKTCDEKEDTLQQDFVTYVVKNIIMIWEILSKLEIIVITVGIIAVLQINFVISNIKTLGIF